ncbi:MAG: hypothetical protein QM689_12935 [Oscillospiraceae bacterium]
MRKFLGILFYLIALAAEAGGAAAGAMTVFHKLETAAGIVMLCAMLVVLYVFNVLFDKISRIDGESIYAPRTNAGLRRASVTISGLLIAGWALILIRYALLYGLNVDVVDRIKGYFYW